MIVSPKALKQLIKGSNIAVLHLAHGFLTSFAMVKILPQPAQVIHETWLKAAILAFPEILLRLNVHSFQGSQIADRLPGAQIWTGIDMVNLDVAEPLRQPRAIRQALGGQRPGAVLRHANVAFSMADEVNRREKVFSQIYRPWSMISW